MLPLQQACEGDHLFSNIIFTFNKGLFGVGLDRPVWETIRNLKAGETYEHIITKSEL